MELDIVRRPVWTNAEVARMMEPGAGRTGFCFFLQELKRFDKVVLIRLAWYYRSVLIIR
jgi:hypothetical protein